MANVKGSETMTREDWLFRYKQFFVSVGLSPKEAECCAGAEPFEILSRDFEDDPEGAAQEEMSYWEP